MLAGRIWLGSVPPHLAAPRLFLRRTRVPTISLHISGAAGISVSLASNFAAMDITGVFFHCKAAYCVFATENPRTWKVYTILDTEIPRTWKCILFSA